MACSGGMYWGVPVISPFWVEKRPPSFWRAVLISERPPEPALPTGLARPQSITVTSPNSPSMMLSGLRSRWMTPRLCA